jgi:hypothetical protein
MIDTNNTIDMSEKAVLSKVIEKIRLIKIRNTENSENRVIIGTKNDHVITYDQYFFSYQISLSQNEAMI